MEITRELAAKVLETVDAGLAAGVGEPIPGQMCVEAAVCYAMGLPHGDQPSCVSPAVRAFKIVLNDAEWSSPLARAKGMRRLAIAQLGSAGVLYDVEFANRLAVWANYVVVPRAAKYAEYAAKYAKYAKYAATAAGYAARDAAEYAAKYAAGDVAQDAALSLAAEEGVQILVGMGAPGCAFLDLAPLE